MNALQMMVERAGKEPYADARAAAASGRRVVGYIGSDIPVELIDASGAYPLPIVGFVEAAHEAADIYLESSFSQPMRSIAEQYLQGRFGFLHSLIFPRASDNAQRLYYYLTELRRRAAVRGPVPLIYDLATIQRDTSAVHSEIATRRLAHELGVQDELLPSAIATRNRRRRLFATLALRRARDEDVSGSRAHEVCRAADYCDALRFDSAVSEWLNDEPGAEARRRVILVGSVPPDERLHHAVEAGGGTVVAEMGDFATLAVSPREIPLNGGYSDIAEHYRNLVEGTRSFADRAARVVEIARKYRADGAVFWLTEEEEALIWALPAQIASLQRLGIPTLSLTRQSWNVGGAELESVASFTRQLRRDS